MTGTIHPAHMPLSEQLAHLIVVATVSAWLTWVWIHEDVFHGAQRYLRESSGKHKKLALADYRHRPHPRLFKMVKNWTVHRLFFLLTSQTFIAHCPNLLFVLICNYRIISEGRIGLFYAWMFATFTSDSVLTALQLLSRVGKLENEAEEAMKAGTKILNRKVEKDETTNTPKDVEEAEAAAVPRPIANRIQPALPDRGTGVFSEDGKL